MTRRRLAVASVAATLFVAIAALVDAGALHSVDRYAVTHWMPWLRPRHHRLITLGGLFLPQHVTGSVAGTIVDVWTYPASVFVSALVVAGAAWRVRTLGLFVLWIAANVVELAGKLIVSRPPLYLHGVHIASFDDSLPSGHTLRAFVVALAVATAFRRGALAFAWAVTIPFALVALGAHTPMDVVAGVCAFVALAAAGETKRRRRA